MSKAALKRGTFRYGEILGHVGLDAATAATAAEFASDYYASQEAIEFSGDDVETFEVPEWFPSIESLLPAAHLAKFGLRWSGRINYNELIATLGVDQHVDDIYGTVLCLVLHNDGLTFKQGGVSHKPAAGDWFVFNDRVNHGVKEAKGASVFLAMTLPLVPLEA
ncbi:hypothetical protein [Paucibacter soli]|uniref:hypothetical protein n=1 Tax=Paucibacter soli TaxID=3133433 RepID=UPI0030A711FE